MTPTGSVIVPVGGPGPSQVRQEEEVGYGQAA